MRKRKHMLLGALAALAVCVCGFTALAAEPTEAPEFPENAMRAEEQQTAGMEETAAEKGAWEVTRRRDYEEITGVKKIEILKLPKQTVYYGNHVAEYDINTSGMELRLTCENGDIRDVVPSWGESWEATDGSKDRIWLEITYAGTYQPDLEYFEKGEQKVRLSNEEASVEFSIQVLGITQISVEKAPKVEYWGEADAYSSYIEGCEFRAVFADGSTGILSANGVWKLDGERHSEIGSTWSMNEAGTAIHITMDEGECEIPVTYKKVKSFSIIKQPNKTTYYPMDWIELYGMELQVAFTDGTSEVVSCYLEADGGDEELHCKRDGAVIYADMKYTYKGKIWGAVPERTIIRQDNFAYGNQAVEITVEGKTADCPIRVVPYAAKQCGAIEVGKRYDLLVKADEKYEYTFTPKETGWYSWDAKWYNKEDDALEDMRYDFTIYTERAEQPENFLKAGVTYTIEVSGWDWAIDRDVTFSVQKMGTVAEEEISLNQKKTISFGTGTLPPVYRFVPKESGVYVLYSEGSTTEYDPWAQLYSVDNCLKESDFYRDYVDIDEERSELAMRAYLTAGRAYDYIVRGKQGATTVEIRRETDTCAHQWKLKGEYARCKGEGWKAERCTLCDVDRYTAISGHEMRDGMCIWCGETTRTQVPAPTPVLKLNAYRIPMQVKQSTTALKVTEMAKGDAVASWKSSNPKIVKVTNTGKLTAGKKKGKAVITVTLKSGKTAKVTVTVQKKKVRTKKIKVTPKKITLKKGHTYRLAPVVTPITTQEKVTYSTSKKKVAAVSKKGVVRAKKPGTAKIKIKSGRKKVTVTVKVTK